MFYQLHNLHIIENKLLEDCVSKGVWYWNFDSINIVCMSFQVRLPPEVNRVLYIRNLPYKITAEEMYDIFGKYGAIRQIRV